MPSTGGTVAVARPSGGGPADTPKSTPLPATIGGPESAGTFILTVGSLPGS